MENRQEIDAKQRIKDLEEILENKQSELSYYDKKGDFFVNGASYLVLITIATLTGSSLFSDKKIDNFELAIFSAAFYLAVKDIQIEIIFAKYKNETREKIIAMLQEIEHYRRML